MLAIGGVDDGFAANLSHLSPVAVECPATDLPPADNVLHELDAAAETHRQLVKELYVLQEVVIRVATGGRKRGKHAHEHARHINKASRNSYGV